MWEAEESALPQTHEGKQTKHWSRHVYIPYSSPCILVYWGPFTNPPFGICAIYFDLKVIYFRSIDPFQVKYPKLIAE